MNISLPTLAAVPFVEHWLGPWAMRETEFQALSEVVRRLDLAAHLAGPAPGMAKQQADCNPLTMLDGGVAMIEMRGRMQKQQASLGNACSTVDVRRAVRAATNDPNCGAILMVVDSPGGTVAGTGELAADIAAAKQKKPVVCLAEDMCCSAAYWVASQCSELLAQKTCTVGSIGTYGVVCDYSAAAARDGVKVHVVKAGAMKGAGTPGTEVTGEQLADMQREIDCLNECFLSSVCDGREMSDATARELATGQVWYGQEAVDKGLVDGIANLDQALARCRSLSQQTLAGTKKMAAASYQEIVAACPGASAEFICEELKAGVTAEQATKDFIAHQQLQIEAANKKAAEVAAEAARQAAEAQASKSVPGVPPLSEKEATKTASGESALQEFRDLVQAEVDRGTPRAQAVSRVAAKRPDLQQAVVADANAGRRKAS